MTAPFATSRPAPRHDVLAPDGSEIRFLPQVTGGSMVHCTLPPGRGVAGGHPPHRRRALVRAGRCRRALATPGRPRGDRGARTRTPRTRSRSAPTSSSAIPGTEPLTLRHRHHAALAGHGRGGAGRRITGRSRRPRPSSRVRACRPAHSIVQFRRSGSDVPSRRGSLPAGAPFGRPPGSDVPYTKSFVHFDPSGSNVHR